MDVAITRDVSPALERCELSFLDREPIDFARAAAQHEEYCRLLSSLGLEVVRLPGAAEQPDCCFVEDVAVVLDEIAVATRPGADSRRGEVDAVAEVLGRFRNVERMSSPATLDGGDVLHVGRTLYVGCTRRSNDAGRAWLQAAVAPFGYTVVPVAVTGCLHLKSAVTALDDAAVLANPAWFDARALAGLTIVPVPAEEPGAGNVMRVGRRLVAHAGFPRTIEFLRERGYTVETVDVSEFIKAEAAVTCKAVLLRR